MEELNEFKLRLEGHFQDLTKSEQRIASYLLANHDEAAFLPASDLAKRLDVSQATIIRFARAVGYESFPELRRCLQEMFRAKVTPATRLQRKLEDLKTGQGHVLTKTIDMELQYLAEAEHSIDAAGFDRAVDIISNAQRVFAFGVGPSRILADLVQIRLRRFGIPTYRLVESGRDLLDKLLLLKADDVVLAAGYHRVSGELVAVLDRAQEVGCPAVLLTDTLGAMFKDKTAVILSARRGPVSNFHSLVVPMTILNAMILAVAMTKSEESMASLKKLQQMRAASGLDIVGKNGS